MEPARAWYFLDESSQHRGPVDQSQLQGSVKPATMLWAEGEPSWVALQDIPCLKHLATGVTPASDPLDELAAFEQEMAKAGAYDPDASQEAGGEVGAKRSASDISAPSTAEVAYASAAVVMKRPQLAQVPKYDEQDMVFEQEEETLPRLNKEGKVIEPKKAKAVVDQEKLAAAMEREREKIANNKVEKEKKTKEWFDLKNNTSVYVTGLPDDVTVDEILEVFGKCGIVKDDAKGQPRVKIYTDKATGRPKGDGLVTYLRLPSVDLAVSIMHDTAFRPEMSTRMTVSAAKFEQKGSEYVAKEQTNEKKKQRIQKQEKGLGWGGFDDTVKREQCTVILKHMFTQQEVLQSEPGFISELETDIAEECCKLGPIVRLKVFPNHPDGVVSVQFKTKEGVAECVQLMNGRWFGGQMVKAALWDGVTNYHEGCYRETEAEQALRLERYGAELERQKDF